jgi:hypothetical protein
MAELTALEMLRRVDALLPNQYGDEQKRRWLAQAEGFVAREILAPCGEERTVPDSLPDRWVMLAPSPYDELYRHYAEEQIHYANGEADRANNAALSWNNAFLTYRDYYFRCHMPRGVKALRLT